MTAIYISFAREERFIADRVADLLRRHGAGAYVDGQPLLPGIDFIGRVGPHIAAADVVLALLSPIATASKWLRAEVAWALYHEKPIAVAVIAPDTHLLDFFFLLDQPRIDLTPWLTDPTQTGPLDALLTLLGLPTEPPHIEHPPDIVFDAEALEALCATAARLADEGDSQRADFIYRTVSEAAPDHQDVAAQAFFAIQGAAIKQVRVIRLMRDVEAARTAGHWAQMRQVALQMLLLEPDNATAIRAIIAECDHNERGQPLYTHARNAAAADQWPVVSHLMRSLKSLYPNYGDPEKLCYLTPANAHAMQQLAAVRIYESFYIPSAVAFAADGSLVAFAWPDRMIQISQLPAGTPVNRFSGDSRDIGSLAFSIGRRLLVSAAGDEEGAVRLWAINDESNFRTVIDKTPCAAVGVSPDKKMLAVAMRDGGRFFARPRNVVRVWVMGTSRHYHTFRDGEPHGQEAHFVLFSPDSTVLASDLGDSAINLWDVRERKALGELTGHREAVLTAAFSPDITLLATGSADRTVRLWPLTGDGETLVLEGHTAAVNMVAFSPDGALLATGSADRTIRLWSVPDGKPLVTLTGHNAPVLALLFTPDRMRLLSADAESFVYTWALA